MKCKLTYKLQPSRELKKKFKKKKSQKMKTLTVKSLEENATENKLRMKKKDKKN